VPPPSGLLLQEHITRRAADTIHTQRATRALAAVIERRFAVTDGIADRTPNLRASIARGTLPLAIFGPENYAYRLGLIGAPSRIAQAVAPLGFGLLIEPMGRGVVAVSSGLSLAALVALLLLPSPDHSASKVASPSP
jgi:hypothetical protein